MHDQTAAVLLTIPDTAPLAIDDDAPDTIGPDPIPETWPPPCLHSPDGIALCEACRDDYDEDPAAWIEYGSHRAGLARWTILQEEIEAQRSIPHGERPCCPLPFATPATVSRLNVPPSPSAVRSATSRPLS